MQRILGYLFLVALAVIAIISLKDRFGRGSTLNPFGTEPDWIGIGLIVTALGCGVWILCRREKKGTTNGD